MWCISHKDYSSTSVTQQKSSVLKTYLSDTKITLSIYLSSEWTRCRVSKVIPRFIVLLRSTVKNKEILICIIPQTIDKCSSVKYLESKTFEKHQQ